MHGVIMAGRNDGTKIHDRLTADLPINSRVASVIVDDPLEAGGKLRVLKSVRDDPLAGMHVRKQIDDAQYHAGLRWQLFREDSEIGGAKAIDTTKEAVDGGRFKEPDIERMSNALRQLKLANAALGSYGASLVEDILGRRMSIAEVAAARCMPRQREIDYIGRRFRECLESLAKLWGFAG